MRTWLFAWNPTKYRWDEDKFGYNEMRSEISQIGCAYDHWSCGNNRSIEKGDRIFLICLGTKDRGIVASGYAQSGVFEGTHWDESKIAAGIKARRVYVRFDKILNIDAGEKLPYEILKEIDGNYKWSTQISGVSFPHETAAILEKYWKSYGTC